MLEDYVGYEFYKSLSDSIKIELVKVKSIEKKKQILDKIIKEKLSVRKARIAVGDLSPNAQPGLISCIKDPTRIKNVETIPLPKKDKKEEIVKLTNNSIIAIEKEIEAKMQGIEDLKKYLARVNAPIEPTE